MVTLFEPKFIAPVTIPELFKAAQRLDNAVGKLAPAIVNPDMVLLLMLIVFTAPEVQIPTTEPTKPAFDVVKLVTELLFIFKV